MAIESPAPARRQLLDEEVPAQLRREVRLLGDILGKVLTEACGEEVLADVERLRQATIALRDEHTEERSREVAEIVAGFSLDRAELVARAFTVYFQLINLAEEHQRVRTLRERGRRPEPVDDSIDEAVATLRRELDDPDRVLDELLRGLVIRPVLTAHPTEARRVAVANALNRVAAQLVRLDDPRITAAEEADVHRRLAEEITALWRTGQLREEQPTPLDEVRRVMAAFDESLFRVVPQVYRELDRALSPEDVGARPSPVPAFLRWGSWVGGDRDGNPNVTADVTRETMSIHADHVLRGLENATRRIARSLTASDETTPPSTELLDSIAADEARFPRLGAALRQRARHEPHARKLQLCAQRLVATRSGDAGRYERPEQFCADLEIVQRSLVAGGAARLAYGELQHLLWQAQTFGFHLASLEVRQHSEVHQRVIEEIAPGTSGDAAALARLAEEGWPPGSAGRATSDEARELLATLRAMAELQARYGAEACRRYVVSFSRSAADIVAVRALARLAVPDEPLVLDVVPLFETRADLDAAPRVLDELLALPSEAARLDASGRELEVMLGYSDSAKDAGFLAANVALYKVQATLADWARERGIKLTLFHGRGGALGRGGGPTNRAVRGQAPGSVDGRFKVTEQGEVIFARYRSIPLARRHLEQVTNAVLLASAPIADGRTAAQRWLPLIERMAEAAEAAYRDLVERPGFAEFFSRCTPSDEIDQLRLGSRPSRRKKGTDLASLRAIPWVFAWGQSRINLPGWFGFGTGAASVADVEVDGLRGEEALRAMYAEWPFFTSLVENAEMSLVKADPLIAERYLALGGREDLSAIILDEYARTRDAVLAITGQDELLASKPVLHRAVALRNPYVDALSFLQLRFLSELRAGTDPDDADRVADLVRLTINGVSAGLQNTG
ncbi:MAG TPA: phosphoenolpyruvate carboxylase [Egibacteraceae bacterium]